MRWSAVIEELSELAGVHHPLIVIPPEVAGAADLLKRIGVPFGTLEGIRLMAPEWRYSSGKARRELGYRPRGATQTLERTVNWYLELIEDDRLPARRSRSFDVMTGVVRAAQRTGLLLPLKAAGQLAGRRTVL
jgi:hypothetical protein